MKFKTKDGEIHGTGVFVTAVIMLVVIFAAVGLLLAGALALFVSHVIAITAGVSVVGTLSLLSVAQMLKLRVKE